MKKCTCLLLIGLMFCSVALAAAPQLSDNLFLTAKQAVFYLSSGEYERLVTLLPFSDVAPSASEWERFAGNFLNLSNVQTEYSVGYWTGSTWQVAVPVQVPDNGSVEALVLTSDDGVTFSGYRYALWSRVETEYSASEHVTWNVEYIGSSAMVITD